MIEELKNKARSEGVPIIKDDGLSFMLDLIKKRQCKEILELGTAVAYSSICMAQLADDIHIDTLEKNDEMYEQAILNVKEAGLQERITIHHVACEDFVTDKLYDFIFVDAAKAQYPRYLEQFLPNLKEDGIMLFDNMVFHQMIYDVDNIRNRNTRSLVRKIVKFREKVRNDTRFDIIFFDDVGDGLLMLARRK